MKDYIHFARNYEAQSSVDEDPTISPITTVSTTFSSLGLGSNAASSATSYLPNAHAVSKVEAQSYYAGLHSEPMLLYCMGKEWFPPSRPEAQPHFKELHEVFNHLIMKVWNHNLGWMVVKVMEAHKVS